VTAPRSQPRPPGGRTADASAALASLGAVAALELALARATGGALGFETVSAAAAFATGLAGVGLGLARVGVPRAALVALPPFLYGGWIWVSPALERSDALPWLAAWGLLALGASAVAARRDAPLGARTAVALFALLVAGHAGAVALREDALPPLVPAVAVPALLGAALALGRHAVVLALVAALPPLPPERWEATGDAPALPDVLLVSVDTLRWDAARRMASVGRIAREGALLPAQAPSPWTLPSLATLLTGQEPARHGAGRTPRGLASLPASARTLAERLAERGYDTAASVHSPFSAPVFGLDQGFARFRRESVDPWVVPGVWLFDRPRPLGAALAAAAGWPATRPRDAEARLADARAILAARRDRPLFLWVHFLDPHVPYRHAGRLALPRDTRRWLARVRRSELPERPSPEMLDDLRRGYANEVAVVDAAVETLLDRFAAHSGPHGRVVVLTSDHGEEFGEHGGFEHGHTLYQELLAVPLAVAGLPVAGGGGAGLVDVVPTLLARLDADAAGGPDAARGPGEGRDLGVPAGAAAYRASNPLYGALDRRAVKRGPLKLVVREGRRAFYDLLLDPGEHHPRPEAGAEGAALVRLLPRHAPDADRARPLEPGVRAALEALGYAPPAPGPDGSSAR